MSSGAIVVVDPTSTGRCVCDEAISRGHSTILLWSQMHVDRADNEPLSQVDECSSIEETVAALARAAGDCRIIAVICGGDSGVSLADRVAMHMGLPANGRIACEGCRSSKAWQQAAVAEVGLRACRTICSTHWADVHEQLIASCESVPLIVKLAEGTGTEGVRLCASMDEARTHFEFLLASQRATSAAGSASSRSAVVVQEFLRGREFVVDTVSRLGEHKVVMLWEYDKRAANGAEFVYHGEKPLAADSDEAQLLMPYVLSVLDACGVSNGAAHTEVILTTPDGHPCLVEVNARCHGGGGVWIPLAAALCGYTQVSALIDAYVDAAAFDALPRQPPTPYLTHGAFVCLVAHRAGIVTATPGFDAIRALESFLNLDAMGVVAGRQCSATVDLFSVAGMVVLAHPNAEVVAQDVGAIRELEARDAMFCLRMPSVRRRKVDIVKK